MKAVFPRIFATAVRTGAFFFAASSAAEATEPSAPESNWRFDVTSFSSAIYSGDNRDTRSAEVETLANDNWALLSERIDTRASTRHWSFALRLDGAYFPTRPNPTQISLDLVELRRAQNDPALAPGEPAAEPPATGQPSDPTFFRQKVFEAGGELSNRYINWIIPSKYSASYRSKEAKVTVGDFYAQFGRGMVLSVRKEDALYSDTTIRGARLDAGTKLEKTRIKATFLAGSANPLRIDPASGRYLGTQNDVRRGFQVVTEAGMPHPIETDFAPKSNECITTATCDYAPDNLYGAQITVAPNGVKFSTQAALLTRHTILSPDVVRGARQIFTASQSLEVPSIGDFASLYFEGAGQERAYEESSSQNGYALYGDADVRAGIVQFVFEGKHYRAFYPLSAGISTARAREFSQIQYSRVPTTEPIWNATQFENFNTCTTGGRSKMDVHITKSVSVFTWVGRFNSWAESVANEECEIKDENLNRVWDLATGTELSSRDARSRTQITIGVRDDTTDRNLGTERNPTYVFYREAYTRYDALFHIRGPYSVQFQGWHRYQNQTIGGPDSPWFVGQTVNALEIAPFGNIAFGFEYDTNPRTPDVYLNGQATYRMTTDSNLSLFVGQRRGAQLCVGGVCRVFPPFEGARLDLTMRFF